MIPENSNDCIFRLATVLELSLMIAPSQTMDKAFTMIGNRKLRKFQYFICNPDGPLVQEDKMALAPGIYSQE